LSGHKGYKSEQVIGLDCLRFFAAMLVLMFHMSFWGWYAPDSTTAIAMAGAGYFPKLGSWFNCGWVGVQIFFVISGFVISYTANTKSPYEFLRSRTARLYPDAWICATITLCFAMLAGVFPDTGTALARYARSMILFPSGRWIDDVYWSLRVEISFYALVCALLLLNAFQRIELVISVIGCVSAVFCVAITITPGNDHLIGSWIGELLLLSYGCCFALGATFWLSMRTGINIRRAALCCIYVIGTITPTWLRFGGHAAAFLFLGSLGWIGLSVRYNDAAIRAIGNKGVRYVRMIGLATYPIYLLHDVVGAVLVRWLVALGLPNETALGITIAVIVAAGIVVALAAKPLRYIIGRAMDTVLRWLAPGMRARLQQPTFSAVP
jgi:peptidoglycan/LPS O-acetylase OafA/YrhL